VEVDKAVNESISSNWEIREESEDEGVSSNENGRTRWDIVWRAHTLSWKGGGEQVVLSHKTLQI